MELLSWIEQPGFSAWVRESGSLWGYPTILFLHTAGLAFLVGPSIAIGSRVLGFIPSLPYPIMWTGFWLTLYPITC
jgi:hypothetical protein